MKKEKIELLAPAGDLERAKYAIANGADAIYIGGKEFSARSSASNFDYDDMREVAEYATLRGVKVFLAVNTLVKNSELHILQEYLEKVYECGIRTLIIQDIGVAKFLHDKHKEFILHASTQLTAHSISDVLKLKEVGFKRVVLSRELSLKEIEDIVKNTDIEIEVFCHGANCVCYSGQCLMSSLIGGRSGNRGKCAQPCRLSYELLNDSFDTVEKGYLLSPKDTFAIEHIEDLINIGVKSLKIEGRMKNKTYVSTVTSAYRNKIDSIYENSVFDDNHIEEVTQIFNRGGSLSTMYMDSYSSKNMMSNQTPKSTGIFVGVVKSYKNRYATIELFKPLRCADVIEIWTDSAFENAGTNISQDFYVGELAKVEVKGNINEGDRVYKTFDKSLDDKYKNFKDTKQIKVCCDVIIKKDIPMEIKIYNEDIEVVRHGRAPELALNQATSLNMVYEKLGQTGNTTFELDFKDVVLDDGLFVSIKELKDLRKEALSEFEKIYIKDLSGSTIIKLPVFPIEEVLEKHITVEVNSLDQLGALKGLDIEKAIINLEQVSFKDVLNLDNNFNFKVFCKLPRIAINSDEDILCDIISKLDKSFVDGFMACTYGELLNIQRLSKKDISLDASFNIYNSMSMRFLQFEDNVKSLCISPEVNLRELRNMGCEVGELIVYGRPTFMVTRQCPVGLYVANKNESRFCSMKNHKKLFYYKDRKDEKYPILCNCEYCYGTILDYKCINLLSNNQLLTSVFDLEYKFFKLIFTTESGNEVKKITSDYIQAKMGEKVESDDPIRYYGHYLNGVL